MALADYKTAKEFDSACNAYLSRRIKENKAPTISGLALHLHCSYNTLRRMHQGKLTTKQGNRAFRDVLERMYLIYEDWLENKVCGQSGGHVGLMFTLKNMFAERWKDRQQADFTTKGQRINAKVMLLPTKDKN